MEITPEMDCSLHKALLASFDHVEYLEHPMPDDVTAMAREEVGYRMHATHASVRGSDSAKEILAKELEPQFPVEAEMVRKGLHFMLPSSWAVEAIEAAIRSIGAEGGGNG